MKRKDAWTDEHLEILRANAGKIISREIGKLVGRTTFSVQGKIAELNLPRIDRGKQREWSEVKIEAIKNLKPGTSAREFARVYHVGIEMAHYYARKLGVQFNADREWTEEELTVVRACRNRQDTRAAARQIGRSGRDIDAKWRELDIKPAPLPRKPRARKPRNERKVHASPIRIIRVTERTIDYCPQCHAPVSNWSQHYERMGHIEPRLQAWYEQQAAKRSA